MTPSSHLICSFCRPMWYVSTIFFTLRRTSPLVLSISTGATFFTKWFNSFSTSLNLSERGSDRKPNNRHRDIRQVGINEMHNSFSVSLNLTMKKMGIT